MNRLQPVVSLFVTLAASAALATQFQDRWFFMQLNFSKDKHLEYARDAIATAGKSGYNGLALECGVEEWDLWDAARQARLEEVKRLCAEANIEIIPLVWSVGYGWMLPKHPDLMEGIRVRDVKCVVRGGRAEFAPSTPGLPLEPLAGETNLCQSSYTYRATLLPFRLYRVTYRLKTEGLAPKISFRQTTLRADREDWNRNWFQYGWRDRAMVRDSGWTTHELVLATDAVSHYGLRFEARRTGGTAPQDRGRMLLGGVRIEEIGPQQVMKYAEYPMTVTCATTGRACRPGADYLDFPDIADVRVSPFDPGAKRNSRRQVDDLVPWPNVSPFAAPSDPSLALEIPEGSALKDGDELRVMTWVPGPNNLAFQRSACMANPDLKAYFNRTAATVKRALDPKKWFLSMDEVRHGGTCPRCEAYPGGLARLYADCICAERTAIRAQSPDAQIYMWSDMIDPVHNTMKDSVFCRGSTMGADQWIPRDIVIVCWWGEKRNISMPFFASHGFRTMGAAYYDSDSLDSSRNWLDTCRGTPECRGIMYTTWEIKYELLGDFGRLCFGE